MILNAQPTAPLPTGHIAFGTVVPTADSPTLTVTGIALDGTPTVGLLWSMDALRDDVCEEVGMMFDAGASGAFVGHDISNNATDPAATLRVGVIQQEGGTVPLSRFFSYENGTAVFTHRYSSPDSFFRAGKTYVWGVMCL